MAEIHEFHFSVDVDRAIRDPLFWFGIALNKITFGLIDTGRWKRYVKVDPHDPQIMG
ncbi:hypothetical protein [Paracoccus sp. (in: a-proteobacteria)]|uniref:hypothetical protein n=1 Tax=Paracoccus sp. TaxID=267 RepID=UPI0028AB27C8|nr:hypothetical protein [Paracoccus sp. (in: a-proteobacteria)]